MKQTSLSNFLATSTYANGGILHVRRGESNVTQIRFKHIELTPEFAVIDGHREIKYKKILALTRTRPHRSWPKQITTNHKPLKH